MNELFFIIYQNEQKNTALLAIALTKLAPKSLLGTII